MSECKGEKYFHLLKLSLLLLNLNIMERLLHNRPGRFQSINFIFIQGSSLSFTDFLAVRQKQVECECHDLIVSEQDSRS